MSKKKTPNCRKLSIYLIKTEHQDYDSVIKGSPHKYPIEQAGKMIGMLFIKQTFGNRPTWLSLFEENGSEKLPEALSNQNVSAVFLVKCSARIFAITFGYGRGLLMPDSWEERFGLKVVLNSIDPEKIKVIDRKDLDSMLTHTRTQTSKECAIREFNLDFQQILLKAVTGEPINSDFADKVSGADSLSIVCEIELDTIDEKCSQILKMFEAKDYKKEFSWLDYIYEVTNGLKNKELNEALVNRINSNNTERLFLAVPDIVEWTDIAGFKFRENDEQVFPDILLQDFLATVRSGAQISVDYLKHHYVFQVRADSEVVESKWSVFKCLNCEIADSDRTYILTEGKWYEVNMSFVSSVNSKTSIINKWSIPFQAKKGEKENDFCRRLYEANKTDYALMDRRIISYGGGHSKMEFCDIFTKDRKLIHIKRYGGSSVLSHLFTQGANCGRALRADVDFRKKVNEKLPGSHQFDAEKALVPSGYQIVFGIISERADELPEKLPFFSKISLLRATQELQMLGYSVSLAGIRIEA
jgi:uncharacterized protein (TIGR04141 family)